MVVEGEDREKTCHREGVWARGRGRKGVAEHHSHGRRWAVGWAGAGQVRGWWVGSGCRGGRGVGCVGRGFCFVFLFLSL